MTEKKTRTYTSIVRQKQAEETRDRVADAAEILIKENGYESTTIGAVAKRSGVATQTVYAIFGSKQGILMYLVKRAIHRVPPLYPDDYICNAGSMAETASMVAEAVRRKSEVQLNIFNALGGFEMLYPELNTLVTEEGVRRKELIAERTRAFCDHPNALLKQDKHFERKLDLFWAVTDGCLYHLLVTDCGWPHELYEKFLAQLMIFIGKDIDLDIEE